MRDGPSRLKSLFGRGVSGVMTPAFVCAVSRPLFELRRRRLESRGGDLRRVRRVLVLRLDEIGDVVLTTPFLREVRRNLPSARITLLVGPATYNLVERCPYADEVIPYPWDPSEGRSDFTRYRRALSFCRRRLWRRQFDLAVIPRWDIDYYSASLIAYLSRAPWRVGYSEAVSAPKKEANRGYDRFLSHAVGESPLRHEVERNLEVIRFLGGEVREKQLEVWLDPEDESFAGRCLAQAGVSPGKERVVGVGPGARWDRKRWPVENFAELGSRLMGQGGTRFLILGGPGEEALGETLKRRLGESAVNIAGRTTLRQAAALLKRCDVYVGNDSGLMHLAAAVRIPVAGIFCHPQGASSGGPSLPDRFHPWADSYAVLQPDRPVPPCEAECTADSPHCILSVKPDVVQKAVERLLDEKRP